MNVQYAIQRDKVFVIEVNPRASRTVPYVSKATGVPLAKIAARLMTGRKLREFLPENIERRTDLDTGNFYFVKSPVFPWGKFPGVDTVLGPEMKSTGEVMGVADNFGEAFAKAQAAAGQVLPTAGTVFMSGNDRDKPFMPELAKRFVELGFSIVATHGTARVLEHAGLQRRASLQSERRPAERGRPDQGRAHSAHHQYAARRRAMVRREGHSSRRRHRAHSHHHYAVSCEGCLRRHRRVATRRSEGVRVAAAACGESRSSKVRKF